VEIEDTSEEATFSYFISVVCDEMKCAKRKGKKKIDGLKMGFFLSYDDSLFIFVLFRVFMIISYTHSLTLAPLNKWKIYTGNHRQRQRTAASQPPQLWREK
jgi:hypothetical protein